MLKQTPNDQATSANGVQRKLPPAERCVASEPEPVCCEPRSDSLPGGPGYPFVLAVADSLADELEDEIPTNSKSVL